MVNSVSTLRTATIVIVGSVGIAIVVTKAFSGVPALGTVGSTVALSVLAAPLAYAGYRVVLLRPAPTDARTNDAAKMSAEEVKQRTERWSEEAAVNPAFPPGHGPDQQSSSSGEDEPRSSVDNSGPIDPKNRDHEGNHHSSSVDPSELEFHWQTKTDVGFDDIGGMDDLKANLRAEVIKPLENPEKAEELGVAAPNIIFHGPPGTGKTFAAEAV